MRIAFLTMGNEIGGAAQDIITLSQGLLKLGHVVFVASSPGVMDKALKDTGVIVINAPLYTRNPVGLWKASRKIRKLATDNNIEILNPQGMYTAFSAWLATFGFKKSGFLVITTIHMISSMKLYKFSRVLNLFSTHIITESFCERNRLTGSGVDAKKITVVSNSVDMDKFSKAKSTPVLRNEYKIEPDCCCFGIVARLSWEKRHPDFIAAARLVHKIKNNTKFFIIGDGPEREKVEEENKGSEDFIIMTGMRRDIPDVLRSLDCFVLCSEWESLPLSIREAMSMELPVIATDIGGIREAVIDEDTGFVVPARNPGLLAEAMLKIAGNKDLRTSLGMNGWQLCRKNFELTNWSKKTEELFSKVLNNRVG